MYACRLFVSKKKANQKKITALKYKIIVAYDGTDYAGWQYQDGQPTIVGTVQQKFKEVFDREILMYGASRTDTGVHALGQVATFCTDLPLPAQAIQFALTNVMPSSILIRSLCEVADNYSPCHAVQEKTYYYHFFQERPLPFVSRFGWYYRYPVDLTKLQECLNVFIGTHDFRSFCTGYDRPDTVRTINSATIEYIKRFGVYRITIKGPKFLRYMIRRIVGACLEVASRDTLSVEVLQKALEQKNPHQLFPTAPAQGLVLYKIVYDQEHSL